MPEQTKHGKFEVDPNYNEDADLAKRIAEVRIFLENELADIDGIADITFQLICLFAMIDCLAQEQANYPRESWKAKNAFCQFVLKHQKQCDYLEEVEPITLYYRVEDDIERVVKIPGFPPEKAVTIDDLGYLYGDTVKNVLTKSKAQEILQYIEQKKGAVAATKLAQEHQLISLLYRMRSKALCGTMKKNTCCQWNHITVMLAADTCRAKNGFLIMRLNWLFLMFLFVIFLLIASKDILRIVKLPSGFRLAITT